MVQGKKSSIKENLFKKLDVMYVLMDIQENLKRIGTKKMGCEYLVLKTNPEVKNHIWYLIESSINYAKTQAYKRGYEKGLVDASFKKGLEEGKNGTIRTD